MSTVTLIHRGIGLWAEHNDRWELLFPETQQFNALTGGNLNRHDPMLIVREDSRTATTRPFYDLRDHWLDLAAISASPAGAGIESSFLVETMNPDSTSAARTHTGSRWHPTVLASVALTAGVLSPAELPLVGPWNCNGVTDLVLAHSVAWTALRKNGTLSLHSRFGGPSTDIDLADGDVVISIENLAPDDRIAPATDSSSVTDEDFAANYLLTHTIPGGRGVPTQPGGLRMMFVRPGRPCSGTFVTKP